MPAPKNEINELRETIRTHDHAYYVADAPTLSDQTYDKLFTRLKKLETEHPELITPDSPTQRVSETPVGRFKSVTHAVAMLSIDNTYNETELREFDARVAKGLDGDPYEYIVDPKIDGVSGSLRYENGSLVLGATRGDGRKGDDVTANCRTIPSIPLRLHGAGWPQVVEIRGEIYWPRAAFDAHNARREAAGDEPFANPRNATAGTIKQKDAAAIVGRGLAFMAHGFGEIGGAPFDDAIGLFEAFAGWGIPVTPHMKRCGDIDAVLEFVHAWDARRRTLEYDTDGLVVKVNRLDQRQVLGTTSRFPRWCIAYKYPADEAESVLEAVDIQVGKRGTLTPRARMRPVQLSGTTVRHASLHNFDQVDRLDIRIGDTIIVKKAGEIIPQVVRVVTEKRPSSARKIERPTSCPVCKGEVAQDEGGVYLRCINPSCDAQIKERLKFFCGRDQMDIEGLGDVIIEKLVDAGLVHSYADLYKLVDRREELIALEIEQQRTIKGEAKTIMVPFGEKRAETVLASLEDSKLLEDGKTKRSLARVFAALNIRHVGGSSAEALVDAFGTMQALADADDDALQAVDGIGPELAACIVAFFRSDVGRQTWQALRDAGVKMAQAPKARCADQPLAGKTLVVTGTLEQFGRKEIERLIKDNGGKVSGSISKNTDYLVAGQKAGSKLDKAKKLGVQVLDEAGFLKLIQTQ